MTTVPPLSSLHDVEQLDVALSLLLEPSPVLHNLLVPSVHAELSHSAAETPLPSQQPATYADVLDICERTISTWSLEDKAEFLSGHPLIGEVKGLSALSKGEQGGAVRTPPIVLARLAHLNKLYTKTYSGLPYVTFVAGRPRSAIAIEMEQVLGLPPSPDPLPEDFPAEEPDLDSDAVVVKPWGGEGWRGECERALVDVFRIAKARLAGLGIS